MFRDPRNLPGEGIIVGSVQIPAAAPREAIGKIGTAIGSVTIMRADGVLVRPSVGALVYQGDTIETGTDGAVGITFIDGTVFNLSATSRLVLNEFSCERTGTPNSALFSLVQGAFSFVAGKIARTGGLNIDTPFATIRGSAQDRGIGVLTLAALTFVAIKESEAASRHDAFLDDGTITYKDLAHGTFEIVTRDGRVIVADDPGETIVVDPTGSVARLPNSASRMAELQQAQHSALATFSLGQEGGAAGGSSSPGFDIPVQLQPINFSPPRNDAPTELVTTHITAASSGFILPQQLNPPPVVTPVLGSAGFSMVTETINTTGSTHFDTVSSGTLTFTDFEVTTVSATMASMTWSGGATPPSGLAEVLAGALSITTESANPVSGSIATTFSAADRNFDFLAANETLTIVYDVTVTDNQGVSLTRPVTITIIGTNDAPVLAADASGPHTVTEGLNTTGTFVFTDVDLTDHHTVSTSVTSATWSGGATLPSGVAAALAGALSATASDGTGSGSGSVAVTFSAADSAFDFLASGETLTVTYNVTVSDITGASSTQPVTITIHGTNDAAVIGDPAVHDVTEDTNVVNGNLTASGTLSISDADQTQASFQTGVTGAQGNLGSLTLQTNGSYTYTVANSAVQFLGVNDMKVDTFTVMAFDGTTKQISFTIHGTNDATVIGDPAVHDVTEDTNVVNGNLTASGTLSISDADQTQASFQTGVTGAQGNLGSLTLQTNGSYTYTVANSAVQFLGVNDMKVDTFTVMAFDGTTKQISFTIHGTNDATVIGDPAVHDVTEDTNVVNGNLTASGTLSISDADQTQASFQTGVTGAQGNLGSLTLQTNGSYTYTVANSAVQFLGVNDMKVDTFTVMAFDGTTKQISFTIHGTNDATVIGDPAVHDVTEDTNVVNGNLTASGTLSISDADQTQASFQTGVTGAQGNLGSLTLQTNGSYTYTVANSAVQFLGVNDMKVDTFTVMAFDGTTKQISFTIHGTNDATVIGDPAVHDVTEDTNVVNGNLTASGTLSISDADQTQASFQTGVTGAQGNLGSLTLQTNGSYTYTVANSAVQFLGVNDMKVDTFTVTAFDGTTKQISFTIHGTNDATVIGDPAVHDVTEDTNVVNGNLTASGTLSISDADQTQASFQTGVTGAQGNLGSLTLQTNGSYTYTVANSAVQFLGVNDMKVDTFTVMAFDGTTKQISFTIHGTNDATVIGDPAVHDVTEDTNVVNGNLTASGTLSISDADQTQASFQTGVTGAQGNLGSLTLQTNGSYTYTVANSAVQFLGVNDMKVDTFTVTAFDGTTKQISFTIHGTNDAPVITSGAAAVAVSEEGLPNGVPDTLPDILDTTNSTTANGTITASDADGDPLTMTLGAPNTPLTSGGVTIAWTLQNGGHTLVGKAGATTIITATITDAGAYTVTLTGAIDHPLANQEDNKTFAVPVAVSDGHTTTPTTLSVTIEDDSPKAEPVEVSVVPTDSKTNVMLILDLSGSMDTSSGLTGLTRLDVAKAAINEVLDQYDNRGDVMVRIVTFSDTGAAVGSAWQSVANAKAAIAGLSAGGSTNYDAALPAAMGAFTDGTKLTGPGTQNVSYFLSDGDPTAGHGVNQTEQQNWESFLNTNNIVSFALGISDVAPQTANLDPIAFDPASGLQLADTPIRVTDLGQLANALVFTIPPVTGSALAGAGGATSNSFGADGGFVQSITVDGVTYTFNPAANGGAGGITTSGSFTYDGTTKTLTVDTDTSVVGGELAMVMTTGAFTFHPPTGFSGESVDFVLVDRDGDTASSTIHFSAAGGPDHPPIVRDDHVITNISGGSGTNIAIPDYALLYNDGDTDGQTIAITGAITNVLGASSVTHTSGNVTFTDNNTNGGSFTYTGSTTSPVASDTGDVTIDRSQTGTTLTGTGFGEILIGRDGTNNTINANEGNDVLIGGTGNDTLNGGAGADMMTGGGGADTFIINSAQSPGTVGGSGDAGTISGYDVITDFATATDILNLQGTAAAATGTNVNGTDSSLTINGQTIKSHTISNGIITFDDAISFGSALSLSSTANVSAAVEYLHRNDLGSAGSTVAFVANIGGTAQTYIFEQVGDSPSATNDILVDLVGVTLSNLTTLIPSRILPAGVAGSPMNLGLIEPADHVGSVTVAIAGVPSGWTLSEGTNNGDGSWTIQASSVSMLSITSPANYAGAMALQVTMSWTNADGSNGFARATDNVEVFAQGAPIFAWSGEDHLTGSSGKDLFVFAQPIGHDTIYSFNASEDQIDLIGYWGFTNFNDVQLHLSQDSASNAVITLANGQSITLLDVPGSSLSANNFVFDHTPALINTGTLTINDGALLPLSGIITNTGAIALDSTGNEAHLEIIQNGITLQGGGQVVLSDNDENLISGTASSLTLTNMDNAIFGAGQLGAGQMTLINNGTIAAIGTHALVVDTGTNVLTNAGTLEATGSGGLIVNSDVANSGLIWANGGNITINGAVAGSGSAMISGAATLELGAESSANVTFGADAAGTLILRDPTGFTGTISGLSSTDHIDLANMSYETASVYGITYSSNTNITTLVITGGTNTDTISLLGNYTINTAWHLSDDGHGGTIVSEAAASPTSELILVQSTSADNNLPRGPFADVNETANAASDIHVAAAVQSLPNSTALAARAHSDDSTVQAAADINDQFHFAYANPGTLDSPQLLSQAASHVAAEIPLVTANSVISLPHNFNSPALPAHADNLAPQTAENPSLFRGTDSRDDLFKILDHILTDAVQAPLNTVTALDQNHDVAWMNAHHDKPSNDFIIHA